MQPIASLADLRLHPVDELRHGICADELDAALFPFVPIHEIHRSLLKAATISAYRRVKVYLGLKSTAQDRRHRRARYRAVWAFRSLKEARSAMEVEYRSGALVHVLEIPALHVGLNGPDLVFANIGWQQGRQAFSGTAHAFLEFVKRRKTLIRNAGLDTPPHQPFWKHLTRGNNAVGWLIPEMTSWSEDLPVEGYFPYNLHTRHYARKRLDGEVAGRWRTTAFHAIPYG